MGSAPSRSSGVSNSRAFRIVHCSRTGGPPDVELHVRPPAADEGRWDDDFLQLFFRNNRDAHEFSAVLEFGPHGKSWTIRTAAPYGRVIREAELDASYDDLRTAFDWFVAENYSPLFNNSRHFSCKLWRRLTRT
ncbi:hypothetical protein M3Y99_01346500 [Aphelenchoides fujianensis]|nr:hypothetical protein M3Y99_01346500 [Aphelenchoides fujianensis]